MRLPALNDSWASSYAITKRPNPRKAPLLTLKGLNQIASHGERSLPWQAWADQGWAACKKLFNHAWVSKSVLDWPLLYMILTLALLTWRACAITMEAVLWPRTTCACWKSSVEPIKWWSGALSTLTKEINPPLVWSSGKKVQKHKCMSPVPCSKCCADHKKIFDSRPCTRQSAFDTCFMHVVTGTKFQQSFSTTRGSMYYANNLGKFSERGLKRHLFRCGPPFWCTGEHGNPCYFHATACTLGSRQQQILEAEEYSWW